MVRYSALGLQVVITFIVLAWAGIWLDDRYEFGPWGTLGGIALGMIAVFTILLREGGVLESQAGRERNQRDRSSDSDPGGS